MVTIRLTPSDPLCLWCSCVLDDDAVPYCHPLGVEYGVEYRLCWACRPIAWQDEIFDFEAGIPDGDRLLS